MFLKGMGKRKGTNNKSLYMSDYPALKELETVILNMIEKNERLREEKRNRI